MLTTIHSHAGSSSNSIVRKRRRQFPVGISLSEQTPDLLLQVFDGVGTGDPALKPSRR